MQTYLAWDLFIDLGEDVLSPTLIQSISFQMKDV